MTDEEKLETAISILEQAVEHYANQDMSHEDYRYNMNKFARKFLTEIGRTDSFADDGAFVAEIFAS